ncbi:MAG: acetyl-CoA carboxylase, carboxyltransferase subunit beta [Chloroflexota bacterium]
MKEIFKRHPRYHAEPEQFAGIPEDLWIRCPQCRELLYAREHEQALWVCSKCKHHFRISARQRIDVMLDSSSFEEHDHAMSSTDPLAFESSGEAYRDKLIEYETRTDGGEAFVYGAGTIEGESLVLAVTEFQYAGGTMGAVFGEKLARAFELALARRLPLIVVSSGGGARMQEGTISLLQMAKTVAALDRYKAAGLPFFSVLVDPCLGGITASYAMLGDVNLAEPGAYIGFAGRRVIEQTMRQKLPHNAATAEFLLQHGMVDVIVPRAELSATLARLIRLYVTANPASRAAPPVPQYA